MTQLVIDSMKLAWPSGIKSDHVLLFLTDAASYMIKSGNTLKYIFQILFTSLVSFMPNIAFQKQLDYVFLK